MCTSNRNILSAFDHTTLNVAITSQRLTLPPNLL